MDTAVVIYALTDLNGDPLNCQELYDKAPGLTTAITADELANLLDVEIHILKVLIALNLSISTHSSLEGFFLDDLQEPENLSWVNGPWGAYVGGTILDIAVEILMLSIENNGNQIYVIVKSAPL